MSKHFTTTLAELRGGSVDEEMASAIAEVTAAVRATGKKGTVTLSLTIMPASEGDMERLVVADEIVSKPPKPAVPLTFFFVDDRNNLSRKDPQQTLFDNLKDAPAAAPIKDAP